MKAELRKTSPVLVALLAPEGSCFSKLSAHTVPSSYPNVKNNRYANPFPGADTCPKIADAIADLASVGHTADMQGSQTCPTHFKSNVTMNGTLWLDSPITDQGNSPIMPNLTWMVGQKGSMIAGLRYSLSDNAHHSACRGLKRLCGEPFSAQLNSCEVLEHTRFLLCRYLGAHLQLLHSLLQACLRRGGDMEYVIARRGS